MQGCNLHKTGQLQPSIGFQKVDKVFHNATIGYPKGSLTNKTKMNMYNFKILLYMYNHDYIR